MRLRLGFLAFAGFLWIAAPAAAQGVKADSGKQIFETGCASCHGKDGKGQAPAVLGFEPPSSFPDFSDCPASTPETDLQWRAVITQVQIPVSRRHHILASVGYQFPVSDGAQYRDSRFMFSILWDWVDGGPFQGW